MLPDRLFLPVNTPLDSGPYPQPVRVVRGDHSETDGKTPEGHVAYLRADAAAETMERALEHQAGLHAAEKTSWEMAAASQMEHAKREADLLGYARGVQDARKDEKAVVNEVPPVEMHEEPSHEEPSQEEHAS